MLLIKNDMTEPYRNMATEEYLLMTVTEPALMLWRNEPAVIIGKNQDARAEVDLAFTESRGIKVVRRLTGGGAVFHDTGNVNYTFIVPGGTALDFAAFATPILNALARLGIDAERSGRNDLVIRADGRKFSGTAQCVYRRRRGDVEEKMLMHHGTLLFSADMTALSGALTPDREKLSSKGIKSVKSRVVNLSTLLSPAHLPMDTVAFKRYLEDYFMRDGATPMEFSEADNAAIKRLAEEKYATDAWLFGKFGTGEKMCRHRYDFGTLAVSLWEDSGRIARIAFSGDFFGTQDIAALEQILAGTPLERNALIVRLAAASLSDHIMGATTAEIADLILETANI